jgi:hypothetical protein
MIKLDFGMFRNIKDNAGKPPSEQYDKGLQLQAIQENTPVISVVDNKYEEVADNLLRFHVLLKDREKDYEVFNQIIAECNAEGC